MGEHSNNETEVIRVCKKCGSEMASDSKHKICDNCRRERAEKIRKWVFRGVATLSLFFIGKKAYDNMGHSSLVDDVNDDNPV